MSCHTCRCVIYCLRAIKTFETFKAVKTTLAPGELFRVSLPIQCCVCRCFICCPPSLFSPLLSSPLSFSFSLSIESSHSVLRMSVFYLLPSPFLSLFSPFLYSPLLSSTLFYSLLLFSTFFYSPLLSTLSPLCRWKSGRGNQDVDTSYNFKVRITCYAGRFRIQRANSPLGGKISETRAEVPPQRLTSN